MAGCRGFPSIPLQSWPAQLPAIPSLRSLRYRPSCSTGNTIPIFFNLLLLHLAAVAVCRGFEDVASGAKDGDEGNAWGEGRLDLVGERGTPAFPGAGETFQKLPA